ncbi:MAG: pilus (MSHA type) biogenesis protein MshL [Burkholderiales bacterium]|nr:pilus (MSHA type) biogenesis protein MshL [Burkholderiales bacterium]
MIKMSERWPYRRSTTLAFVAASLIAIGGCAQIRPSVPQSEGHIAAPAAKPQATTAIPPPARVSTLVPPPVPQVKPQTYSVVVHEVPVKELLVALARDTKQNIDIHPALGGLVSLNAINETLPAILERISRQVDMRYEIKGNTLIVSPDTPYIRTYVVNYVNIQRTTNSTTGASGQLATTGQQGGQGGGASGAGNTSSTTVTTTSNSDFWKLLEQSVRSILNSSMKQSQSAQARQDRLELIKQEQELRTKQIEAASKAGQSAPALASSMGGLAGSQAVSASLLPDDVIVNPVAGTITVNGTEKQHQLVSDYLTKVERGAQRQVLIEATIVEVNLSDAYQGGIDWSRLPVSGGLSFSQQLLRGFGTGLSQLGANFFQMGYTNPNSDVGNFNATVKLLQEFGNTRVLSSPKLMVLNNQTALLKAVDNLVYFEIQAQSNTTQGVASTTFNSTAKTVALGVVMGVTPQVNDDGRVLLTVRPTISRFLRFRNDPNPSLCDANRTNCVANPVPEIQVREMESVLQIGNGQTIILGGLMQDNVQRNREQLPGADRVGDLGELFRFRDERVSKSELVIFLRPTVVPNPSLDSDELKFFQRFLPQAESAAPAPKPAP